LGQPDSAFLFWESANGQWGQLAIRFPTPQVPLSVDGGALKPVFLFHVSKGKTP
tara:strand:+ start:828 stop:989 length:162 start_codon:yes stop_codon:yes gene_type:complete